MRADRRCDGCVFYERHPLQVGVGLCRRGPPAPVLTAQGVAAVFPPVAGDNWCHQHRAPLSVFPGAAAPIIQES